MKGDQTYTSIQNRIDMIILESVNAAIHFPIEVPINLISDPPTSFLRILLKQNTAFLSTFCMLASHRRDILDFLNNLMVKTI